MVQIQADARGTKAHGKRREILDAASFCFRERGFHATGMRDVAARAGMTVGNLYYYFRNKEELLGFCQEETLQRLDGLARELGRSGLPAAERLFLLIEGQVVCLNEGIPGSLAHLEIPESEGAKGDRLRKLRDRHERRIRRLIRQGMTEGAFRELDPKVATLAILGAVNWTVRWFRPEGGASAREIGRAFAEQLVRGLLAEGEPFEAPDDDDIPIHGEDDDE
ncbi:MAG TPA: TetR/AcrR family transcriptional regulator [Planctomycetes bacterium]|nr:TetR/AcrR family transcriptional regulator [Planctomycetota bacterium]